MRIDKRATANARQYESAYEAHYVAKDLPSALELYKAIIATHTDTREAGYSRTQIQNIVNAVVPQQELIDAQVNLALACLKQVNEPEATPDPALQPAEGRHS